MTGRPAIRPRSAPESEFAAAIREGLTAAPKRVPPQYFYDDLGSALFDAICRLPWYEVTRAELRLLTGHGAAIAAAAAANLYVELGPGNGEKLAALARAAVPGRRPPALHLIDVSRAALDTASRALAEIPGVTVTADRTTYRDGLRRVPRVRPPFGRTLLLFLGSNIGNFDPAEARALLCEMRGALQPGDQLLLGTDLVKPEPRLRLAYDDPLGVTAAFNKNLLVRINRELDATFDLESFGHRAVWNAAASRVEMHLVSDRAQTVDVPGAGCRIRFEAGESIWTESSYKYETAQLADLGRSARFAMRQSWIDEPGLFALTLFEARG